MTSGQQQCIDRGNEKLRMEKLSGRHEFITAEDDAFVKRPFYIPEENPERVRFQLNRSSWLDHRVFQKVVGPNDPFYISMPMYD